MIGAISPPWEQWYSPLQRALQVIGTHRTAWYWIHTCFVVGVVLTILGFVAFAQGMQAQARAALLSQLVQVAYVTGAVFWLVNIAFRTTVQVWAANEVVRAGAIPASYEAWHRWAGLLFAFYMALGHLACAGLGWTLLRTGLTPRWAGWFAITFSLTGGAVVGRSVPFMVHVPLVVIGVLLLRL